MSKEDIGDDYGSQSLYYDKYYDFINVRGKGIGARAFQKLHEAMEKPYNDGHWNSVLEIGAGSGEHLDFIRHSYDRYVLTDIRESALPSHWLADPKIESVTANAEDLPFPNQSFDRIIVTCLLHHVEKPEKVMQEIMRLLKPDGVAMLYLTCDPGLVTRMLRNLTTHRAATRAGFQGFNLMMAREHRNHVGGLLEIIKYVFRSKRIRMRFLPFLVHSWNLNGSVIVHIS